MKPNSKPDQPRAFRSKPLALAILAFVLGMAATVMWQNQHHPVADKKTLSDATKNLLGHLPAPVTIHYYALLPVNSTDEPLSAFAGRVGQMLKDMQTASSGKIQISDLTTADENNSIAARAEGIQPFNLDKGDACLLGLTVASGKNQEAFARLQPEWEGALEYDLARAIARVSTLPISSQAGAGNRQA